MNVNNNLQLDLDVSDLQALLDVPKALIESTIRAALTAEGRLRASLSIVLVDDATIHRLNARHLGHDWPTDIITFPLDDPDTDELSGELVISAETARTVAGTLGIDPLDEVRLYVVHGILHLCGYDDHDPRDRARMREREAEILAVCSRQVRPPDRSAALLESVTEIGPWT